MERLRRLTGLTAIRLMVDGGAEFLFVFLSGMEFQRIEKDRLSDVDPLKPKVPFERKISQRLLLAFYLFCLSFHMDSSAVVVTL